MNGGEEGGMKAGNNPGRNNVPELLLLWDYCVVGISVRI